MGKYFGTDGVRGIANRELTPELAFRIGRCGGYVLAGSAEQPTVLIGRDTRRSGEMLEAALVAGLLSIGAHVIELGVISTPGVAYITRKWHATAGIMISASHNPARDNGIKFFGADGFKICDETELEIEALIDADEDRLPRPTGAKMGTVSEQREAKLEYAQFMKTTVRSSFEGIKVVLDCANGAAYEIAPRIFEELGAEVIAVCAEPDGLNINENCGSTYPERVRAEVLRHQADVGLAFDGDADRLIAVDDEGTILDGDYILSVCGEAMHQRGELNKNTIVTTVMSNLGFFKTMKRLGLNTEQTAVGDRCVMEAMKLGGYNLGGEQSGHIIFIDYNTTGDGILSALQLVDVMIRSQQPLSRLKDNMQKYPQILLNINVKRKEKFIASTKLKKEIETVERQLGEEGRVLVRPSGTEQLIRVMIEGPDMSMIEKYAKQIAEIVKLELN